MLPRKRTSDVKAAERVSAAPAPLKQPPVPAEPAANPFALSPRRAQVSVSDEITKVKKAPPLPSLPPPPPRTFGGGPLATVIPPSRAAAHAGVSRKPPPIPRELPRASMAPPSFQDFEPGQPSAAVAAMLAEELPPSSDRAKPISSDAFEPVSITHHPPSTLARPNASWAMALLALGVFGGVVTAIVAGGETDSILRAGATFIDPNGSKPATAAANAPAAQPVLALAAPQAAPQQPAAPVEPAKVAAPVARDAVVVGDPIDLGPAPVVGKRYETKIAPFARVIEPRADKVEARPAPKAEPKVAAAPIKREAPKVAKAEKPEPAEKAEKAEKPVKVEKAEPEEVASAPAAKPGKKGKESLSSAAAADALAKMQLEGAL